MANFKAEDVTRATETANKVETAVRDGDHKAYSAAMDEVNTYRKNHTPEEAKTYAMVIEKKLEADKVLPAVTLFEAQHSFKDIDTSGNGRLEKDEVKTYRKGSENELQRRLLKNVTNDYDNIRQFSTWGENIIGMNSAAIADQDINDGLQQQRGILNLHAPDKNGESLYDRINKDKEGNIPGGTFDKILAGDEALAKTLTPQDKETIKLLKENEPFYWFSSNDFNKDDLRKFEKESQLDPDAMLQQPRGSRAGTDVPLPNLPERQAEMRKENEEQTAKEQQILKDAAEKERQRTELEARQKEEIAKQKAHDEKLNEALKVNRGESYAHSADRLLKLAGHDDYTKEQLREVSHQLWIADNRRKAGTLPMGHTLAMNEALRKNPALAKLFDGSELK